MQMQYWTEFRMTLIESNLDGIMKTEKNKRCYYPRDTGYVTCNAGEMTITNYLYNFALGMLSPYLSIGKTFLIYKTPFFPVIYYQHQNYLEKNT